MIAELTSISSMGLVRNEMTVLHSILKILKNLNNNFKVLEAQKSQQADLVFVDAGDTQSLQTLKKQGHLVTPILITDKDKNDDDVSLLKIRRPIILKRVQEVIDKELSVKLENYYETTPVVKQKEQLNETKHILIVDDSYPVRKYMQQKLLSMSNQQVSLKFAENGKDTILQIQRSHFDAVFLDVMLPDLSGYKICRWIKQKSPKTKIIMLTGKKSTFDKVKGSMSGCDAYLTKPPDKDKLEKIIYKLVLKQTKQKSTLYEVR